MANPVDAQQEAQIMKDFESISGGYTYPAKLDLRPIPGTDHDPILERLMRFAREGRQIIQDLAEDWRKVDYKLRCFMPADEFEQAVKDNDWRKPVTTVIPLMFQMKETYQTFFAKAFFGKVLHRYVGQGSTDRMINAALYERLVAKQDVWFRNTLAFDTMFGDAMTYGVGVCHTGWSKHRAFVPFAPEVEDTLVKRLKAAGLRGKERDRQMRQLEEHVYCEGNEQTVFDPYKLIIQPNTTPNYYRKAEYKGWLDEVSAFDLLADEDDPEAFSFNGIYAREWAKQGLGSSELWRGDNERNYGFAVPSGFTGQTTMPDTARMHRINLMVTLIPYEWGLSNSKKPEKWMFRIVGDRIITQMMRLPYAHGGDGMSMMAPNTDGHSSIPASHIATMYSLQEAADWREITRNVFVRTIGNGSLTVVDPSHIEWEDVLRPGPGKIIRARNMGFGDKKLSDYIQQLQVQDVTQGHVEDIGRFIQMAKDGSGTNVMDVGMLQNMPERTTARGAELASGTAFSRLSLLAIRADAQAFQEIGYIKAFNTMQFMDEAVQVSILGRYEQQLRAEFPGQDYIDVHPDTLDPYIDVEAYSGATNAENLAGMAEIVKVLLADPNVQAQYVATHNTGAMIDDSLEKMGVPNIRDYVTAPNPMMGMPGVQQPMVADDEQLMQQVQAGNMVPVPGGMR